MRQQLPLYKSNIAPKYALTHRLRDGFVHARRTGPRIEAVLCHIREFVSCIHFGPGEGPTLECGLFASQHMASSPPRDD